MKILSLGLVCLAATFLGGCSHVVLKDDNGVVHHLRYKVPQSKPVQPNKPSDDADDSKIVKSIRNL